MLTKILISQPLHNGPVYFEGILTDSSAKGLRSVFLKYVLYYVRMISNLNLILPDGWNYDMT